MKYLLDTCVLLWALEDNRKKLGAFASIISNPKNLIFVSIASYWEIVIKQALGRIILDGDLPSAIEGSGFLWLDIKTLHIDHLRKLPLIHHDPFDRLLISQSTVEKLKLLTTDTKVMQYP